MAPAGIVEVHIRGPALFGPRIRVGGPAPGVVSSEELTPKLRAAIGEHQGPVSILTARDPLEIQDLSTRWPVFSEPGWLVGTQTNEAQLSEAYDEVGVGGELRILIAPRFDDVIALSLRWPQV
jgi:hypothetical protein